ncbi:lipopolysaccharide biosynthesis protein [Microbacterium saperdae]
MPGSSAFRAARITLLGQLGKFVIQVTSLYVLARLLSPFEYGLYGMVMVFAGFGLLIGDFGLASASIQAKVLSAQQRTNLFWSNVALGVSTALIFIVLARPIAGLFGEDALVPLILGVAALFVVQAAATQFAANATRDLRFGLLAVADVVSQLVGLVVAILCALAGFGAWTLVIQQVVVAFVLLVIYVSTSSWHPSLPRRAPMRSLLVFGLNTFLVQVLNFFTAKVDSFVVGKLFGATSLGFYDRAYQVNQISTQQLATPLTRVALPMLSRYQDDIVAMRARLLALMRLLSFGLGGLILFIGANSAHVVEVALGSQWASIAPLLSLLAVGGFFQAVGYVYYWGFLSLGKTGLQLRFSLWTRPIMVVLIVVGALFGVEGVAIGVSAGMAVNWLILTTLALPRVGIAPGNFAAVCVRAVIAWAPIAVAVNIIQTMYLPEMFALAAVAVNFLVTLAFMTVFLSLPVYRRDLRSILETLRSTR